MSATTAYDEAAAQVRRPPTGGGRNDRDLIRMASLAASSHNTQPWTFTVGADAIVIRPDLTRRCPVVDPDDAHLYKSIGCATENLVQAARAQGVAPVVDVDPAHGSVTVAVKHVGSPHPNPLADAILTRQCTRASYDGTALSLAELHELMSAGTLGGARCTILTEPEQLHTVAEFVRQGNLAQLNDATFRRELVSWIRFNSRAALATRDGLAGRATGQPSVPTWFGTALQRMLITADKQARLDDERLESSAGVAVVVTTGNDIADWIDAGRAYQRFALRAEVLDVRTAFVNQPIEAAQLRPEFEAWLGLADERAQLAIRFGHGPRMPDSLRRPVPDITTFEL
jgi:hypothetical protein